MALEEKKYLSLNGLTKYDGLIKDYIDGKSSDLDGALADEIERATAAEAQVLTDAKAYTDEQIGELADDAATVAAAIAAEAARAAGAESDLQDAIDAEEASRKAQIGDLGKVGESEDAADQTVKGYVDAAVEAINGDADALADRVEAVEATHATKTVGDKEVFKTVAEEVNEAVVDLVDGAPEALNTLKEIADWIANQDESGVTDAATLVSRVESNAQAIADEQERAEGAESNLQDAIDAVDEKVDAFVVITDAEIEKLFE